MFKSIIVASSFVSIVKIVDFQQKAQNEWNFNGRDIIVPTELIIDRLHQMIYLVWSHWWQSSKSKLWNSSKTLEHVLDFGFLLSTILSIESAYFFLFLTIVPHVRNKWNSDHSSAWIGRRFETQTLNVFFLLNHIFSESWTFGSRVKKKS